MSHKLTPATIQIYATEVANLGVSKARAAEIAPEVEGLNSAVRSAATSLDLNDEPAQFARALVRNRQPRGKAR